MIAPQTNKRPSIASEVNQDKEGAKILKALIIVPNEKTSDVGSLLAIARSQACRREHVSVNPTIKALMFVAELGVYVAVYQVIDHPENGVFNNRMEK